MKCEKCGGTMVRDGSSTITGRKLTDYRYPACGNTVPDVDEGIAIWKAYELADQEERQEGEGKAMDSDVEKNKPDEQ